MIVFLTFAVCYFATLLVWFELIQKPIFILLNRRTEPERLAACDVVSIYRHGFETDCIIAAYGTAVAVLIAAVRAEWAGMGFDAVIGVYNALLALPLALLSLADAVLYSFWRYKIDASVLAYLRSPKAAMASVSAGYLVAGLSAVLLLWILLFAMLQTVSVAAGRFFPTEISTGLRIAVPFVAVLLLGALFVIIRGLKIRPNNPSLAYFSPRPFLNHAALNPVYNFIYSLTTRDEFRGRFHHFDDEECRRIVQPLFPTSGTPTHSLLTTDRPNILLIVWESLGAEFVGPLGGHPEVTPQFSRLAKEGIFFTGCTATSFRTDRGLVGILSGVLGQPTTSLIRYTRKLPVLPALPRKLKESGYRTTAVQGGDLTIMHKSDYYIASGHDRLVSRSQLPKDAPEGKWGVHDGWMFRWLYDDIMRQTAEGGRWFTTFQTLSSHEPFDVPEKRLADPCDNSFAYVDAAFGEFVDRLKKSPSWENLLIVVVADHGYNSPTQIVDRPTYAHIPILMLGGAVKQPAVIPTIMSQTDLAATLLGQLGIDHADFPFSRDVLADSYREQFSFHTYVNGFMLTDSRGVTDYDNVAESAVGGSDPERERRGKAILQYLYDYIAKL